jgi:hypothetical protein
VARSRTECRAESIAFAAFVGSIDPLCIDAEHHLRIDVPELARDPRWIVAGHQCEGCECVSRLIGLSIAHP